MARLRLRLLGVGAMASPRYAPAGLLALAPSGTVAFDGGLAAVPDETSGGLSAWLVTDIQAELIADIRRSASSFGLRPTVSPYAAHDFVVEPRAVEHTSHGSGRARGGSASSRVRPPRSADDPRARRPGRAGVRRDRPPG